MLSNRLRTMNKHNTEKLRRQERPWQVGASNAGAGLMAVDDNDTGGRGEQVLMAMQRTYLARDAERLDRSPASGLRGSCL